MLFNFFIRDAELREPNETDENEREKMYEHFAVFLELTGYPEHKQENTIACFRRLMGRAVPTKWEFHTMMGVFERARLMAEEED